MASSSICNGNSHLVRGAGRAVAGPALGRRALAGRFRSQFRDKNRRDIGKSQSIWTDSKSETAGSPPRPARPGCSPPAPVCGAPNDITWTACTADRRGRQEDGRTKWTGRRTGGRKSRRRHRQADQMDRQADKQADRREGRQAGGQRAAALTFRGSSLGFCVMHSWASRAQAGGQGGRRRAMVRRHWVAVHAMP
jgi:hypothetical protein